MLHPMRFLNFLFTCFVSLALISLTGCKEDTSTQSEEEAAYLADYESPENKWGFIDKAGKLVIAAEFDDVGPFSEGLAAVNQNGKWGYIDRTGQVVIPINYKSAWAFHEGFARVLPFDGPDHFITKHGTILSGENWSAADDFSNGRARVMVGNLFGYVDTSGQLLIQPIYSRGWNFDEGVCIVEYQDKLGVIDLEGGTILKTEYDQIKKSSEKQILLCKKGNTSFALDFSGKELLKLDAAKMVESNGESISIREGDKMYLVKIPNATFKTKPFVNIVYLGKDLWAGRLDKGYHLLNKEGTIMSDTSYTQINKFSDGFAAYSKGDYWGYLDTSGHELTGEIFGLAWDYKEGLARAAFKEGIAFINASQELAFYPPDNTIDMRDFSEGLASVQMQ